MAPTRSSAPIAGHGSLRPRRRPERPVTRSHPVAPTGRRPCGALPIALRPFPAARREPVLPAATAGLAPPAAARRAPAPPRATTAPQATAAAPVDRRATVPRAATAAPPATAPPRAA